MEATTREFPASSSSAYELGVFYELGGKPSLAITEYHKVLALEPGNQRAERRLRALMQVPSADSGYHGSAGAAERFRAGVRHPAAAPRPLRRQRQQLLTTRRHLGVDDRRLDEGRGRRPIGAIGFRDGLRLAPGARRPVRRPHRCRSLERDLGIRRRSLDRGRQHRCVAAEPGEHGVRRAARAHGAVRRVGRDKGLVHLGVGRPARQQIAARAKGPEPRSSHLLVYDEGVERVVLVGGYTDSAVSDSWGVGRSHVDAGGRWAAGLSAPGRTTRAASDCWCSAASIPTSGRPGCGSAPRPAGLR